MVLKTKKTEAMRMLKKHWLTLARLEVCCAAMADTVRAFQPDYIVSIKSGGWYIGHRIHAELQVPHYSITVRRPLNQKKTYGAISIYLRLIPMIWHVILFYFRNPVLEEALPKPAERLLAGKKILLIDDAVQSGKTFEVAIAYLQALGVSEIKTAVISNVYGNPIADHCCYRGVYIYPWSRPSFEYAKYIVLRKQIELAEAIAA